MYFVRFQQKTNEHNKLLRCGLTSVPPKSEIREIKVEQKVSRSSPSGRRQKVQKWATSRRSQECFTSPYLWGTGATSSRGRFSWSSVPFKLFVFATLFSQKCKDDFWRWHFALFTFAVAVFRLWYNIYVVKLVNIFILLMTSSTFRTSVLSVDR